MLTATEMPDVLLFFPGARSLSEDARNLIRDRALPLHAAAGSLLFDRSSPCPGVPILYSGEVRVSRRSTANADGRGLLLYRLRPGEFCAHCIACVLADEPAAATGLALEEVRGVTLPPRLVKELVSICPEVRSTFLRNLARWQLSVIQHVDDLAYSTLEQRLAKSLLERPQPVAATHSELAEDLGTAREVVSRILKDMENRKLIGLRRGEIWTIDAGGLRTIAEHRA